jgi:hypothetical protein
MPLGGDGAFRLAASVSGAEATSTIDRLAAVSTSSGVFPGPR